LVKFSNYYCFFWFILFKGENRSLTPELTISEFTPPLFIFGTADDKYANSLLVITNALRDNNIPFELHVLAKDSHGYELLKGNVAAKSWPALVEKWLSQMVNRNKQ
jgi:acetyl esterase/lipase